MADSSVAKRLPRNFHRTFKPERQYIHAMLQFAASGQDGDYQKIAAATGIPTGTSSGKVPAILDYCRGMGLIRLLGTTRSATKKPELTLFGRVVLLGDPYLRNSLTQWLAHINLCSPLTGADVWYRVFFEATHVLGPHFSRRELQSYLASVYGTNRSGLIGALIGSYEDEAAFKACGVITECEGKIIRESAPVIGEFGIGYGAWIIQLIGDHFPKQRQVPVTDLDAVAGWRAIPGWDTATGVRALELIERKGLIEVDRHMEPWLIFSKTDLEVAWEGIYNEIL